MRRSILTIIGGGFLAGALVTALPMLTFGLSFGAHAEGNDLLSGCGDVPEAVALVQRLETRTLRLNRYLQEIDRRKAELAAVEADLAKTVKQLGEARRKHGGARPATVVKEDVDKDVERLVTVYDQMKPEQAASVISNLPPEFAAELLMRIQPENSAKIIASVDPNHGAILTSYMGSRRARP